MDGGKDAEKMRRIVRRRERCRRYAENLWMAEKMRKTYGKVIDSGKDTEDIRKISR